MQEQHDQRPVNCPNSAVVLGGLFNLFMPVVFYLGVSSLSHGVKNWLLYYIFSDLGQHPTQRGRERGNEIKNGKEKEKKRGENGEKGER